MQQIIHLRGEDITMRTTIFTTRISRAVRALALLAGVATLLPAAASAQVPGRASVTVGGVAYKQSLLVLSKAAYEVGHFAVSAELTRDDVEEARAGGAEDEYAIWAGSLAGRYYTRAPGRGVFAELGAGYGRAALQSTDATGRETRVTGSVPIGTYGAGVRLGRTAGGVFGELGWRNAVYLREQHLHTGATPPAGSRDEPLSDGSWFFGRGARTSQLYVGLGYSF